MPEGDDENAVSQVISPALRETQAASPALSTSTGRSASQEMPAESIWAKELIDALFMHSGLMRRYRRLVHAAREGGNVRQEGMFLELGKTQERTCRQQRQQMNAAVEHLGADQSLMSELFKANDTCTLELRAWEKLVGSGDHSADNLPGQPLQVCIHVG